MIEKQFEVEFSFFFFFLTSSSTFCNSTPGLHKLMLPVCVCRGSPAGVLPLVRAGACAAAPASVGSFKTRLVMSGDAAVKKETNQRMSIECGEMSVSGSDVGPSIVIIIT